MWERRGGVGLGHGVWITLAVSHCDQYTHSQNTHTQYVLTNPSNIQHTNKVNNNKKWGKRIKSSLRLSIHFFFIIFHLSIYSLSVLASSDDDVATAYCCYCYNMLFYVYLCAMELHLGYTHTYTHLKIIFPVKWKST